MSNVEDVKEQLKGLTGMEEYAAKLQSIGASNSSLQENQPRAIDRSNLGNKNILSMPLSDPSNPARDLFAFERVVADAIPPVKESAYNAGYDLAAYEPVVIPAWGKAKIDTKIKLAIPKGMYGRIASRSGLSAKNDLEVGAGVIDPNYHGNIIVILRNHSDFDYSVKRGDRIAQLILTPYKTIPLKEVPSVEAFVGVSDRGTKGFGSSGL